MWSSHRESFRCSGDLRSQDIGIDPASSIQPSVWSDKILFRHTHEDEFVFILVGEVILVEDGGESVLRAGDCAAFPKGTGNGHHLINRSESPAAYLEIGSRHLEDMSTCSDIDLLRSNVDGRFLHKNGSPYTY